MQLSVEYGCTDVAGWHRHSGGIVRAEAVSSGLLSTTAQKHCTRVQAGMHLHTMHLPRDPWLFSASAGTEACSVWPATFHGLLSGRLLFGGSDSPTCFCVEYDDLAGPAGTMADGMCTSASCPGMQEKKKTKKTCWLFEIIALFLHRLRRISYVAAGTMAF